MIKIFILLACLLSCSVINGNTNYDEDYAIKEYAYSIVSYCSGTKIFSWDCVPCKNTYLNRPKFPYFFIKMAPMQDILVMMNKQRRLKQFFRVQSHGILLNGLMILIYLKSNILFVQIAKYTKGSTFPIFIYRIK